jgi:hypothetical protein
MCEKVPAMKMIVPWLSIKFEEIKGPIGERDLSKCEEFGTTIAFN